MSDWRNRIAELVRGLDGVAGLVIQDDTGGLRLEHNADRPFPAASLIKLPIYLAYRQRVAAGELNPGAAEIIPPEAVAGGSGVLQHAPPGASQSLGRIADLMLTASDNTAANLLIDILGMARINAAAQALGMRHTLLQRKMMDFASREAGRDNVTTPRDVAAFLEALQRPGALDPEIAREIVAVLRRQTLVTKLPAALPPGAVAAHKTGELEGVEHDAGLIFRGDRCAVVAVLTAGLTRNADGVAFCREIGRLVSEALAGAG